MSNQHGDHTPRLRGKSMIQLQEMIREAEAHTMDPNETLRQIRELLAVQHQYEDDTTTAGVAARRLAEREIAEHAEALDNWLSRGGFLPDAWRDVVGSGGVWYPDHTTEPLRRDPE